MMTVFSPSVRNPHSATVTLIFEEEDSLEVVKSGCFRVIIEVRHHCRAIGMLKEEDGFSWTEDQLCVCHVTHRYGMCMPHAEAIKLCKVANTSTANDWRYTSFVGTMKALLNYAGSFKLKHGVKFVSSRTKDIVDDTQSSDYFPAQSCETYNVYRRFCKLVIKKKRFWTLSKHSAVSIPVRKWLDISHVDTLEWYVLERDDA